MTAVTPALSTPAPVADVQKSKPAADASGSDGGFSFADFLDIINPLQHIPIVSTLYRAITGDKIDTVEQLAGDTLYGGVIGFAASLANIAFKEITGKDAGETVLAFLEGKDDSETAAVASAAKTDAPEPVASGPPRQLVAVNAVVPTVPPQVMQAGPAVPPPVKAAALSPAFGNPAVFMAAFKANGVDADLGMRALYAYQKSLGLSAAQP